MFLENIFFESPTICRQAVSNMPFSNWKWLEPDPSTLAQNLKALAEKLPMGGEIIARFIIKKKNASPGGTITLTLYFQFCLESSSTIQKNKSILLTIENLICIQQATNLSNTNTWKTCIVAIYVHTKS